MEITFPDIPLYEGWGRPLRVESTVRGLELISGHLPEGLEGAWYRGGPDRQYPPMLGDDIFIDGEGMAHMFRFKGGQVDYVSRWVRTARFEGQEKARRSLFGRYRNRYTNDPSVEGISNGAANTTAVFHAGKLLVLKEDDLPYALDPETLETIGRHDYDGQVRAVSMTAHPKVDTVRDALYTFSYQAKGDATTDIVFYEIDGEGRVVDEIWFNMPYAACVHDFAVTDDYAIFPFFPLITDLDHIKAGGTYYQWHADKETMVAIVKRGGTAADIRWFRGPAMSAGHMMNAFQDGSTLHLDLCLYEGNCFPFFKTPEGVETAPVPPILTRMSFDLARNDESFDKRPIMRVPCEMPRTDERYQGRSYRNGFAIVRALDGTSGVGHVDVASGALKIWKPGPASSVQEPQFVPRTPDSAEGDGWLLVIVNRLDQGHSDLAVLDATDIEAGPVALFRMPVRVRSTFHGMWTPEETLRTGHYVQSRPEERAA
jgi:carotenoid cleavage dioxygenase